MAGGLFGIGGRGDRYGSFTKTDAYDESKYQYKGYAGGARDESANLEHRRALTDDRAAPTVDRGDAQQSRGFQYAGLGQMGAAQTGQTKDMQLLESAATGAQPSRAEILGKQMSDRALRSQVSAAGNVRGGPGAAAAAYRTASQGAMGQRADMAQGIQAERAAELERARGTYSGAMGGARRDFAGAAQGVRGQDENAAQFGASHELASRTANDARAMGYEQMGQQINRDALGAGIEQQKIAAQSQMGASTLNADANKQNAETDKGLIAGGIGMIGGALGSLFKSDPNAKVPMSGSLAALGLGGMSPGATGAAPETFSGSGGLLSGSVAGEDAAHKAYGTRFQANPAGDMMMSGMVSKEPALSAMASKDPYSDPRAKLPVDQEAARLVEQRRKAGGYAHPDTKPIASDDQRGTSDLHQAIERDTEGATPYERDEEVSRGVAGAPRGYAKEHPSAPEEDGQTKWTEPDKFGMRRPGANTEDSTTKGMAPGTDDWARFGEDAKKEGDPDWSKGGATKKDAEPGGWRGLLAGSLAGLASGMNPGPRVVYVDRDTTTSDPKAKAAAFQDGAAHAHVGGPMPDYMKGQRAMQGFSRTAPATEAHKESYDKAGDDAMKDADSLMTSKIPGAAVPAGIIAAGGVTNKAIAGLAKPEYKSTEKKKDSKEKLDDVKRTTAVGQTVGGLLMPGTTLGTLASEAVYDPWRLHRDTTTSDERTKRGFADVDTSDMAEAMRSMKASPYQYKSEFRPPEQKPGEVNVGPMADAMAKDEVARTAIVKDDESDMLAIDKDKGLKLVMGSLAALQSQVDDLKGSAPRGNAKKARTRGRSAHA